MVQFYKIVTFQIYKLCFICKSTFFELYLLNLWTNPATYSKSESWYSWIKTKSYLPKIWIKMKYFINIYSLLISNVLRTRSSSRYRSSRYRSSRYRSSRYRRFKIQKFEIQKVQDTEGSRYRKFKIQKFEIQKFEIQKVYTDRTPRQGKSTEYILE